MNYVKLFNRLSDFLRYRSYRRVLLSRLIDLLLRRFNRDIKYIAIKKKEGIILCPTGDSVITPYTLSEGGFQRSDFLKVIRLMNINHLKCKGVFFDVGANIGTTSIYARHTGLFTKIFCFEPAPDNIDTFTMNMRINKYDDIVLIPYAVSGNNSTKILTLSIDNSGDNRVNVDSSFQTDKAPELNDNQILVKTLTLDTFTQNYGIKANEISLVWIDTQGHEGEVLTGASQLLKQKVPLCLEFWPYQLHKNSSYENLIQQLEKNYNFYYDLREPWTPRKQRISSLKHYSKKFITRDAHTDILVF